MSDSTDDFFAELDTLGEPRVRVLHELGKWIGDGTTRHNMASEWLYKQESLRAARADAREEETLDIARKAIRFSRNANIWAAIAAILSAIATAIAYVALTS